MISINSKMTDSSGISEQNLSDLERKRTFRK